MRLLKGQNHALDDYDSTAEVSTFKPSTILEFKNGKGTIDSMYLLDKYRLRWLREQFQAVEQEIKKYTEQKDLL